ncbi:MAG TPA: phospholipase D-like domain-containing protein [Lapillicoccus sp.]|nr:phospholipase D-like domain-containing protein [Lapillicoccus sp.]
MSLTVTGTVVDEAGKPLPGLLVEARGDWLLTSEVVDSVTTRNTGDFTLVLSGMLGEPTHPSSCRVRVVDDIGRPISDDKDVPGTDGNQSIGRITVRTADRTGLEVTNGTGVPQMVSEGNAMTLLIDGLEAFGSVATDMAKAEKSLNMTQLFFGTPDFDADPIKEKPKLVFAFGAPPIVPLDPLPAGQDPAPVPRPKDQRPERLVLEAARKKVNVRILLNEPVASWPEGVFWLLALPVAAAGLGTGAVGLVALVMGAGVALLPVFLALAFAVFALESYFVNRALDEGSDVEELQAYMAKGVAALPQPHGDIIVRGFEQPAPDNGVLHTKMVIADGQRATVLGSPYSQRYFDDQRHVIDNPERGDTTSDIVHDVSVGLIGPVIRDLHETFRVYWNEDVENGEEIPPLENQDVAGKQASGTDGVVKLQVVRTLSAGRFRFLNGRSEKGILESYLRAFNSAKRFIYLENQYFTDSIIADALARVLKDRTDLELIFLLNIKPDVLLYPGKQARLVKQLRAAAPDRVGVFTRWSYDHAHSRPWVAPIYLHSKTGVVDDTWATIGSANLDGLSLDHNTVLSPLAFGETTAAECNVTILEGTPGPSGMAPAERLRRRLWAEHLGMVGADGNPRPEDNRLAGTATTKWLPLWKKAAADALTHVKNGTAAPLPGFILECPEDAGGLVTPRKHLAALEVPLDLSAPKVRPIGSTRPFTFYSGRWGVPNREDFVGATRREEP